MYTLELKDDSEAVGLFGARDENLKLIERRTGVRVAHRNGRVTLSGPENKVSRVGELLDSLLEQLRKGRPVHAEDVSYGLLLIREEKDAKYVENSDVLVDFGGRVVRPRTPNQRVYVEAIEKYDLVFGVGPAGTGKTYLAVAMALKYFKERRVERIVIARPAVEAGEKLGFLPGDYQEKVNPYLRPVYDALFSMKGAEKSGKLIERGAIEVAPLAYMRGRTLDAAFVILDEAQNTTIEQMKMFLTRLGRNSFAVVNGDITQIDLPPGKVSGLIDAERRLKGVGGLEFVHFDAGDVVRHDLVGRIILAYQNGELSGGDKNNAGAPASKPSDETHEEE